MKILSRFPQPDAAVTSLVVRRDGYMCMCCGAGMAARAAGVMRRRPDLGDSPANLITVLDSCRDRIAAGADPHDEAAGYRLQPWQDPAVEPVMIFSEHGSGATVWLTADGGYSVAVPRDRGAA